MKRWDFMIISALFEKALCGERIKRLLVSLLIGFIVMGYASEYYGATQQHFSKSLIRFHVIADSDSEQDQTLKLIVRDEITEYLKDILSDVNDIEETKTVINASASKIKAVAEKALQRNGCTDGVVVETGVFEFPEKAYGEAALPAGDYYALRVVIGKGEGKNWWCILYPDLCVGIADKNGLESVLTDDTYNIVTDADGTKGYKFKFKILELFGK